MKTENPFHYGKTNLAVFRDGWGGSFFQRRGSRALCADGKVRSLSYLAPQADTFFSIPAAVRVGKRYVRGYITTEEAGEGDFRAVAFRHLVGYEMTLPKWPEKFSPQHNALLASAHEKS